MARPDRLRWSTLLTSALVAAGCGGRLAYEPDLLLYSSDTHGYEQSGLRAAFDAALEQERPVIVFVHGRGREPRKSLEGTPLGPAIGVPGQAVSNLERLFGARVLMVSWPSARGGLPLDFDDREEPLSHMAEAAGRLRAVLAALEESLAVHARRPPVVLLAHSMGSIVVETYVRQELSAGRPGWPSSSPFDAVVFSSADSDNVGHEQWLEPLAARETVYVTVNPGDAILRRSDEHRPPGAIALGLEPGPTLAPSAVYVELQADPEQAKRFERHELFSVEPDGDAAHVARFFASVLTGQRPVLREGKNRHAVLRP